MDGERFDAVARGLGAARSRRGVVGALAGMAALALGGAGARDRGRGRDREARADGFCATAGQRSCSSAQIGKGKNVRDCNFSRNYGYGIDVRGKTFAGADATRASFRRADARGTNFNGAVLQDACFRDANLTGATFRAANLGGADLTGTNLTGADFRGANVTAAQLAAATMSCGTTLPNGKPGPCPAGTTCCGRACVDLRTSKAHCGACGNACATAGYCAAGACAPASLVFVSSTTSGGNLGGLAGGDATCNALATTAGLPGTYKAWLSDATASPSTRFTRSAVPYALLDGTVVAADWAGLTSAPLAAAINLSETGATVFSDVWTGTKSDGTLGDPSATCLDWTIGGGDNVADGGTTNPTAVEYWSSSPFTRFYCSNPMRLYCFQQ